MKLLGHVVVVLSLLASAQLEAQVPEGSCGVQHGGALCRPGFCCSNWGFCGTTDAFCGVGNCQSQCPVGNIMTAQLEAQVPEGSCGVQNDGALCRPGLCCSKWGFCGTTDAYCSEDNCQSQCPEAPAPAPVPVPEGSCGVQNGGALCRAGFCCSIWGFCGDTDDYCGQGKCQSQCPDDVVPTPVPAPSEHRRQTPFKGFELA